MARLASHCTRHCSSTLKENFYTIDQSLPGLTGPELVATGLDIYVEPPKTGQCGFGSVFENLVKSKTGFGPVFSKKAKKKLDLTRLLNTNAGGGHVVTSRCRH